MSAQHGLVPAGCVEPESGLLGLQDVAGAAVEVDEALALGAMDMLEDDSALETVGVGAGVVPRRDRLGQVEQDAELR